MNFSATDCVRQAWRIFRKRWWFLVGVTVLTMVLSWLIVWVAGKFGGRDLGGFVGAILNIGLSTLLSMGFTAVVIHAHDAIDSAYLRELWHPRSFWKFLAAEILTGLIIFVGLILFIVPGIIAMLILLFVPYLVIDKEFGPIEAIRASVKITRGSRIELLLLVLIIFVLNVFGLLAFLAGLLVTIPVSSLAIAHAYRALELKAKGQTIA